MAAAENKNTGVFPIPSAASGEQSLLQFGTFTLDLQRHGLYLGSKRVHLTSRPFETLAVLVKHRGKTVEKQTLLDAVWKDAFVTEDSLVKAVREIRRVLGDEKESPQFIQTVPGEGYRFIAEVYPVNRKSEDAELGQQVVARAAVDHAADGVGEARESNGAEETTGSSALTRGQHRFHLSIFWPVAAIAALLATFAGGILLESWRKSEPLMQKHIATLSGSTTPAASFSPDGNWITFVNDNANRVPQVWVQRLTQGEPIPITSGDIPASHPRWSPKNDQIVFDRGQQSQSIWSVQPFGGLAPTLLIEGGRNPNWSSEGDRLVFETRDEIWTADADGTNQRRVDGVPRVELLIADREPSFSPDGSRIAFFQPEDGPMGDIWVIPVAGGQAERLTYDNHLGGSPVWSPDGNYIVFSSKRGGSRTLWKVHRSGGTPEAVLKSPGEDTNPEISRDGTRLIYTNTRNDWVLTLKDAVSGQTRELRETGTDMFFPSFSPRGDRIAFFATVDEGDIHIFTIRTDGTELTQVTRVQGERNTFPRWSADGSSLYFYQIRPTISFRKIPATGGTSFEIASRWRWRTHHTARVDSLGKKVIYTRMEKSTSVATLIREIETGTESIFSPTLDDPQWSPDGRSIAGVELPQGDLCCSGPGNIIVCPIDSGPCRSVAIGGFWPIWAADSTRIFFDRWKSRDSRETWAVSPEGQDEQRIVERDQVDPALDSYDVSGTGQVVYVQFKPGKHQLWMTDFH